MHTLVRLGLCFLLPLLDIKRVSDNPLQTAVLNLFVSLKCRSPNLVVGAITRESVKKALANGITADQVGPLFLRSAGLLKIY